MGCKKYQVGEDHYFQFSEGVYDEQRDFGCVCTFPHNYASQGRLDAGTVGSLALLGAAFILAWRGDLPADDCGFSRETDVPEWIRAEILRNTAAVSLLMDLEWANNGMCPDCGRDSSVTGSDTKHASYCEVAKLLLRSREDR